MRVGKATGSRECAPDDRLRVPTNYETAGCDGGHGAMRLCPPYEFYEFCAASLAFAMTC